MRSPVEETRSRAHHALGAAVAALVPPAQAATGIIIAIDPGHGGSDPGAVANGLQEKDLTLAVSLALKEELETYDGVTVVMTRTSDTRPSENLSDDLSSRVQMAAAADADALVSIHFNSGSPIARGAEVWYGNSSSYNYATHTLGRKLSTNIQDQLTSLGLATAASRPATTRTTTTRTAPRATTTRSSARPARKTCPASSSSTPS